MKSKSVTRGLSISDWLCLGLLLTVMVLSGITVFHTSQNVLDSDAAAEMVLSHHLASEGKLLSQDWFYSTELRVFHVQLIFVTLLKFIPDWSLVRFIGTMFLQLLLLASLY